MDCQLSFFQVRGRRRRKGELISTMGEGKARKKGKV